LSSRSFTREGGKQSDLTMRVGWLWRVRDSFKRPFRPSQQQMSGMLK